MNSSSLVPASVYRVEKDGGKRKQGEARLSREGLLAAFNDQETNRCVPER
jgi:hypothetical protein